MDSKSNFGETVFESSTFIIDVQTKRLIYGSGGSGHKYLNNCNR
ncbi:hypothetical protein [Sulfolobus acidocaldarius]|nr:hypothetical protein [Sulfolobus acidocaldarius]